jgi:arylsulfatase A-like enzyme
VSENSRTWPHSGTNVDQSVYWSAIVQLWSDHGWQLETRGRWSKPNNHETCARIVLMLSVPGLPRNQTTDALVELIDIYPTLAELCGLAPPGHLEGTSFVPLLSSPGRPWKSAAFTCLIDYTTRSIRTDRYRFIQRASGQNELYDCREDPAENHNLASDPAAQAVLAELRAALHAGWRQAVPAEPPPP